MRVKWAPIWTLAAGLAGCSGGVEDDSEAPGGKGDNGGGDDTGEVVLVDGGVAAVGDGGAVDPGEVAAGDGCFSNRDFLATRAWKGVVESRCLACHGPGGIAEAQSAKFTIKPAAYPGFLEANLSELEELSKTSFDGVSVLLSKATGNLEHGGGKVVEEGSQELALLEELVERGIAGDTCEDPVAVPTFDDVTMLSPEMTWRKLTLNLAGRLPSSAETNKLGADGEAALPDCCRI